MPIALLLKKFVTRSPALSRFNPWNVLAFSSGFLIVLLTIPVSLEALQPGFVPLVVLLFASLNGMAIWSTAKASVEQPTHEVTVAQLSRQSQRTGSSILYEGNLGLYQQWYLELRLKEEMARSKRYGLSLALIVVKLQKTSLLDMAVDGWQDKASEAAFKTARSVRTVDLTAALGQAEFAVCLVHCDKDGAEIARHRIEKALELYGPSSGVVVFPLEKVDHKEMIRLAQNRASLQEQLAAA